MSADSHESRPDTERCPRGGRLRRLMRLGGARLLAVVLLATCGILSVPTAAHAATIGQTGPNPIQLVNSSGQDNLNVLMATAAERDSSQTIYYIDDEAKNTWVESWNNTSQYFAWRVSAPAATTYRVLALINSSANQQFTLTVRGTSTSRTFTATGGWLRLDAGTIALPAGTSTLELRRSGLLSGSAALKSLELLRDSDHAAYQQRITNFRNAADLGWFRTAKYGLMFQYGAWGYPRTGAPKSIDQQAQDFDVTRFVNTVKNTGAAYVIWSVTWFSYELNAPISSVDSIHGNGSLTSTRDLIGDVATALQAQGIRFMLYYHTGKDTASWWSKQNWPANWRTSGTGDRTTFFDNWKRVITEIGNRYGNRLDGWLFDDTMVYYPARFEELGAVARSGNARRFVSWNSWVMPRATDFQDVYFGEGNTGMRTPPGAPVGGNGRILSGPYAGLQEHGNFITENDWGVHAQNQPITTSITSSQAINWVNAAAPRNVPLSFNLMMWEDGTMSQTTLDVMTALKNAVRAPQNPAPVDTTAWYRIVNRASGKSLDVYEASVTEGARVTQWTSSSTPGNNQQWQFVPTDNGFYELRVRHSGQIASVTGASAANGAEIVQWPDDSAAHQQWSVSNAATTGYVTIANRNSGRALDVEAGSAADGARVIQWSATGATNQQWQLVKVS